MPSRLTPRDHIEHEHQPKSGDHRAADGHSVRSLAMPSPHPADDRSGRGVLDQQRRADVHPLHRGEVAVLRTGDRQQPVDDHEAGVLPQHMPVPAQ